MMSDYGSLLSKNENEFQDFLIQLAKRNGQVFTKSVDEAVQRRQYATLTHVIDFYFANWKASDKPMEANRDPIGYFVYLDGKFRWFSLVQFVRDQRPATLIHRVAPSYPPEAKEKGIQGNVELEILIGADGAVTVLQVVSGDSLLAPAAKKAVGPWRYKPLLFNGQPVPARVRVTVTFQLK